MDDVRGPGAQPLIHMNTLLGGQPRGSQVRRRAVSRDRSVPNDSGPPSESRRDRNRRISPVFAADTTYPTRPRRPSPPAALPTRLRPRRDSHGSVPVRLERAYSPATSRLEIENSLRKTGVAQLSGFYLVKFAVSATACYLMIQLLITFAEVLLPFIFAVLCCIVLEPLKKFIMRIFQRLAVLLFRKLRWNFCLESHASPGCIRSSPETPADAGYRSDNELAYGGLPEDSAGEDVIVAAATPQQEAPLPAIKKLILAISIVFCMLLSGRVLWLTFKVFFRAGYSISENLEYYREGSARLKKWFQMVVVHLNIQASDAARLLDDIVEQVENIGTVVTQNVLYAVVQGVVTFIFLIYMLWSPIRVESGSMTREVFTSTSRYLKVKCLISAFTGLSVAILLWALDLDLPAAFGLLACIANFLPGVGSVVASLLPCILAVIDVRKSPTQVFLALVLQFLVHFTIDFVIEPVFFGISVEIHSVVVILGIWFFFQVWGVPGMLLSVPLLAVVRIVMRSMRQANAASCSTEEGQDTIVFLDNILEGRWMSSVGERGDVELELVEVSTWPHHREQLGDPDLAATATRDPAVAEQIRADLWALDVWALICDSPLIKDVLQFYEANRLLVDCAVLLVFIAIILFIPS